VAGAVVDDEEDLAARTAAAQLFEEVEKRTAVEDLSELVYPSGSPHPAQHHVMRAWCLRRMDGTQAIG